MFPVYGKSLSTILGGDARRAATCLVMATILFSTGWRIAFADEADGVVDMVRGSEISIKPEFHFLPSVGDKIKICVQIPEVGEAVIGTAVITRIDDARVHARMEKATGKVQPGQIVRFLAAATSAPPAPPAPPSQQRVLVVTSPTAKVMSGTNVAGQARGGQRLSFTKQNGDWYLVEFQQSGRAIRGWVHANDVRVEAASDAPAAGVVAIKGWGTLVDPAGGATAVENNGAVELRVPGVYRDLWPEGSVNAPRMLQPIKGDFAIQVKITSPVNVTGLKLAPDGPANARFPYRAAVLMIWHDANNFVRLERASSVSKPHRWGYQTIEQGKVGVFHVGIVRPDAASYLRLRRKQGAISAWYRQDGDREWTMMEVHRLDLPDEVQVGVSLVNTTSDPFTVRFEDFTVE